MAVGREKMPHTVPCGRSVGMTKTQSVMLYLHVHQPHRLGAYSAFDTARRHDYFESPGDTELNNEAIFRKVAAKSYWPMNTLLAELLAAYPGFRFSLSITGTFIEQCRAWDPELLRSFQQLVSTGRVDIVAETYYHSLAFFYSRFEFEKQVLAHRELVTEVFGLEPVVFRNTELAYNNELAAWAETAGYKGVITEGWDPLLGDRSPHQLFRAPGTQELSLLLKDYRLSDDIAFRFSDRQWSQWPLAPDTYVEWCEKALDGSGSLLNLCMDYETFGEHQWAESGIFDFFREWVGQWLSQPHRRYVMAREAVSDGEARETYDVRDTITWADTERDLSAWTGNRMQQEALRHLYALEDDVLRTHDAQLIADWRRLQTSDHVYYMSTKCLSDGEVHSYFSPYDSPYDAFMYFMNALRDIRWRVLEHTKGMM